jgi:surface antigen
MRFGRRLLLVALLAALGAASALAAPEATTTFPNGQCTYWAYLKRPYIVDRTALRANLGDWNAWAWAKNAQRGGFRVGTKPAAGAIAVWPANYHHAGKVGHVAYVEKVLSDGSYAISEMDWNGSPLVHRRVVGSADGALRFIYRDAGELKPRGHGRVLGLSYTADGNGLFEITLSVSGPVTVIERVTAPSGVATESSFYLAGTKTFTQAQLLGDSSAPGNYTVRLVALGGQGSYNYLTIPVS